MDAPKKWLSLLKIPQWAAELGKGMMQCERRAVGWTGGLSMVLMCWRLWSSSVPGQCLVPEPQETLGTDPLLSLTYRGWALCCGQQLI